MQSVITVYRRAELYEQVWKDPLGIVAARYGVSAVAIGKACRKLGVPLPGLGYWAKKAVGRARPRPPLRAREAGKPEEFNVRRWVPEACDPETRGIVEAEGECTVVVPATLDKPHPLVAKAAKPLRRRKPGQRADEPCLSIDVSQQQLDRALRIMDALLKALEGRGYKVEVATVGPPERWQGKAILTRALVDDAWVAFSLSERVDLKAVPEEELTREERRHRETWGGTPAREVPSGCLTLRIEDSRYDGARTAWRDGKQQRVEDCLGAFITAMRVRAAALRRDKAVADERERVEALAQARREEAERVAREEKDREARLREHVARWRFAQDAREYVAHVRRVVEEAGVAITARGPLDESLAWIEGFADRTDPLTPVRKEAARVAAANLRPDPAP